MKSPLLLALDTSTGTASLALFDGERVLSETTWLAGREHSTRLLVEIDIALERVGRTTDNLSGLVVARGPGSFTGVRVALSVAKGIALALGLPVWGVSSLDVLGYAAATSDLPVRAVLEAGRGRYATSLYARGVEVDAPRLATLEQLVELIRGPALIVGDIDNHARERLVANPRVRLAPKAAAVRRAGFLAELGWLQHLSGDPGNPSVLDAVYLT